MNGYFVKPDLEFPLDKTTHSGIVIESYDFIMERKGVRYYLTYVIKYNREDGVYDGFGFDISDTKVYSFEYVDLTVQYVLHEASYNIATKISKKFQNMLYNNNRVHL